ncbi:histone H1.3-like [Saccopteryx leptura]|uniref:histone H1.3-like n=1 Tax=Saccopteryx leptura TaxID=249018 RepID=UPI00339C2007
MSETAPAVPPATATEKTPVKKKARKSTGAAKRKVSGPPVSELITKAVGASKERSGVSLAALKKALAAEGYDVEKNNSRIKLGLKSLVSKGTLVQTKGTGASGSFKLNKKASSGETKKAGAAKPKKAAGATKKAAGLAKPKKNAKKTPKKGKKPAAAAGAKKVAKSPKVKAAKPKKAAKSPAKGKASKPKAAKAKSTKAKKAAPKKK